ncbi:MAG: hypothetical protein GX251_05320 [Firmicutes bacterium]|nr:hypothetical protein [Bacillota bacterium]
MRVLILHADDERVQTSAAALQRALEQDGIRADLMSPKAASGSPVSAAPYGLVCVITGYTGWWKPQITAEMDNLIKKTMRLEGKKGGAFVRPGLLGSGKALRVLMSHLERQGVIVEDFDTISREQEAATIAKRLQRIL